MNTPPHRIAFIAVILLLLAGAGAWWLNTRIDPISHTSTPRPPESTSFETRGGPILTHETLADGSPDPAAAAAFEQCGKAMMELMRERAGQLAGKQDAPSQLAYALTATLFQEQQPADMSAEELMRSIKALQAKSHRNFARAQRLDPANSDIQWLAANHCFDWDSCQGVQEALQASEPDNMVVWLRAMARARLGNDDVAMEAAFRHAAGASGYDTHRGSGQLAVMEGYAGLPTPEVCNDLRVQEMARKQIPGGRALDAATFVQVMGMMGEHASILSGVDLTETCKAKDGGALAPDRQAGCIHIFDTMANGDTLLERAIAMSALIGLNGDTPAGVAWRERYRELRWMIDQSGQHALRMDLMDASTSEIDTVQAALRAAGRWPPPANWLPDDEQSRSLIQTGHRPSPKTH